MVISGRCEPPAPGWLLKITSPFFQLFPKFLIYHLTASCIEPKWTGRCGALATRDPSGPNKAQEKSNLSFIFVEQAVFYNVLPIYSAIDINRLPNIDNTIGSHFIS